MRRLLLLGRDHPQLEQIHHQALEPAYACISAGRDANSPSLINKGLNSPNEDGLLILQDGSHWLFAVADGHFGADSSHALLEGLGRLESLPLRLGSLSLTLSACDWLEQTSGGTTLLIAGLDESSGSVFGLSFGDSSILTLGPAGARLQNTPNATYLRGGGPISVEAGSPFQFSLNRGETLLLYTDGVNECCYRQPECSVTPKHLQQLHAQHGQNTQLLVQALTDLALAGVDGYHGGQDNLALLAYTRPAPAVT